MNDFFETLNNVVIDCDMYQDDELTELEQKQIKKRLGRRIRRKKPFPKKAIIATAAVLAAFSLGFFTLNGNSGVWANIPLIGAALEEYIDSSRSSLDDYKVVVGKTAADSGIEIQLNEVLLDNGRLVVSSTFRSAKVDLETVSMTPTVYINGEKILIGSHGGMTRVDDTTCISCLSVDLENVDMNKMLDIKISYDDMFYTDTGKRVQGHWDDFEFCATGRRLMAETRTIAINKQLDFEDGQHILIKDLVISPFSATLNYSSTNGKEYISFEIVDQDGDRQRPNRARVFSEESYNRYEQKSLENAEWITITPMRLELKTGVFEPYPEKAFKVAINNEA